MGTVCGTMKMRDRFVKAMALTTTPQGELGWTVKDTSAAGAPTYLCVTTEGLVLTLEATSEAQVVTAYQNDVLPFFLNKIKRIRGVMKVSGINSVTTLVVGVASAQNDTADSVATNAWFRMQGSASTTAVVVETDDGTTDNDDVATGKTLAATLKEFVIDFSKGLSDVRFFFDGDPVGTGTTFNMSAASATQGVQLFAQLQKASGTGTPAVTLRDIEIEFAYADG